jgi:hypothetical protein
MVKRRGLTLGIKKMGGFLKKTVSVVFKNTIKVEPTNGICKLKNAERSRLCGSVDDFLSYEISAFQFFRIFQVR